MSIGQKRSSASSLMVKVGSWFEASATGWGIVAVPLVFVIAVGAAYFFAGS